MADVRALLAAERQSRRIKHPALTYTKTGALICNVCQLNVKSESLWDGHLRSANHKKNARAAEEAASRSLKRRRDEDEDEDRQDRTDADLDRRKMPKSRAASLAEKQAQVTFQEEPEVIPDVPAVPVSAHASDDKSRGPEIVEQTQEEHVSVSAPENSVTVPADTAVDEDEWAAFERDIAPLAQAESTAPTDYSSATISAAPVSAAELAEQQAEDKRKQAELTAEDEQEDERGRMEEEFEIMEEMEERVRKLKEMRERLRTGTTGGPAQDLAEAEAEQAEQILMNGEEEQKMEESDEDDDSDPDDWYH